MDGGVNSRHRFIDKTVRMAYSIAKDQKCSAMFIPGDIFHVRGILKTSTFNMVQELFDEMSASIPTFMITGNHDLETYDNGQYASAIKSLGTMRHIDILDGCSVNFKGSIFAGIPYTHSIDKFKELYVQTIKDHRPNVLMIHQGVDDFRPSPGMPETKLTAKWLYENSGGKGEIKPVVLCGHYHKPEMLNNIINVGAALQHTHGGSGQARGMWTFDVHDDGKGVVTEVGQINVAPKFEVVTDEELKKMKDVGEFIKTHYVKIKSKSLKALEKIASKHTDVDLSCVRIEIEKEFKGAHDVSIAIGNVQDMLTTYLSDVLVLPKEKVSHLVGLFNEVTLSK